VEDETLRYRFLYRFDIEMLRLEKGYKFLNAEE
jgi:hypothetical protein